MLDERSKAVGVTGAWDSVSEVAGALALAGAFSIGAHHALSGHFHPGPIPGGVFGAALGDMGTGSSRAVIDEARAGLLKIEESPTPPEPAEPPTSEG